MKLYFVANKSFFKNLHFGALIRIPNFPIFFWNFGTSINICQSEIDISIQNIDLLQEPDVSFQMIIGTNLTDIIVFEIQYFQFLLPRYRKLIMTS